MTTPLRCCLASVVLAVGLNPQTPVAGGPAAVRAVLEAQAADWNRGDIPAFMRGYWESNQTQFVGAAGVASGWQAVRDRYLHSYPDRAAMGTLTFSDLQINMLCSDAASVVGQFRLDRAQDHPHGYFTLLFRRFPDGWRIVLDHTTSAARAGAGH